MYKIMSVRENISELKQICQYSYLDWEKQPKLYFYIRKVSIYFTWFLLHFALTANQVSILMIAIGLFVSVLFACNYLIAAILLLQICILLDFCDGEIARYRKQQTIEGGYLDHVFHFLVHPSIFAGIAIGVYQKYPSIWVVIMGLICAISASVCFLTSGYAKYITLWEQCRRLLDKLIAAPKEGMKKQLIVSDLLIGKNSNQVSTTGVVGLFKRIKHNKTGRVLLCILKYLDFPYIFIVITLVTIMQFVIPTVSIGGILFTLLFLLLIFSTVTYIILIPIFLLHTLVMRTVSYQYDSFVDDLKLLLTEVNIKVNKTIGN